MLASPHPTCGASHAQPLTDSDQNFRTGALGADAAIDGTPEGFTERLLDANGAPVDVVLESIGGPIVDRALTALAHGGRLVAFGQASGASNMVSLDDLMDHSIGVIGYWATPHMRDLIGTRRTIEALLEHVASGRLRAVAGPSFPLAGAAQAHGSLAARATVGKVTLVVGEAARTTGWGDLSSADCGARPAPATPPASVVR